MNILLTSVGRRSYLVDYFRSNLTPDDRVFGTSNRHSVAEGLAPAFFRVDRGFLVPSIDDNSYIEALLNLCAAEDVKVLLPLFDLDALYLSERRADFEHVGCLPVVSSHEANAIAMDKLNTCHFFRSRGFDVPLTFESPQEYIHATGRYPVVLKPRFGYGSGGLVIAKTEAELRSHWLSAREPCIIQEYVDGVEYGLDVFASSEQTIAVVPKRKIAMRSGETDQAITVKSNDLIDLGQRISDALGLFGPMDVDLIEYEGKHYLLDLNLRIGGGYPTTHMAGVDFTRMVVELAAGRTLRPRLGEFEEGLVMYKEIVPMQVKMEDSDVRK